MASAAGRPDAEGGLIPEAAGRAWALLRASEANRTSSGRGGSAERFPLRSGRLPGLAAPLSRLITAPLLPRSVSYGAVRCHHGRRLGTRQRKQEQLTKQTAQRARKPRFPQGRLGAAPALDCRANRQDLRPAAAEGPGRSGGQAEGPYGTHPCHVATPPCHRGIGFLPPASRLHHFHRQGRIPDVS
jgi:hypothetical protein